MEGGAVDTWAADQTKRAEQLAVLLHAYDGERAYDAHTLSALTGVFATIIGVLSVVGSVIAFGSLHPTGVTELFVAVLPIIPLPFLGWGAVCAYNIIVRGELISLYEDALRRFTDLRLGEEEDGRGLPVPFGSAIAGRVWWAAGSVPMLGAFLVIAVMYLGILGTSAYITWSHVTPLTVIVLVVSLFAFSALTRTYLLAFDPKTFVAEAAAKVLHARPPTTVDPRAALSWSGVYDSRSKRWYGEPLVAKLIGSGAKKFAAITIVAWAATGAIAYGAYEQLHHSPAPASSRAVLFAGQLATALGFHTRPVVHAEGGSKWLVQLDPRTCFRLDTRAFDLGAVRGFAVIHCPPAVRRR